MGAGPYAKMCIQDLSSTGTHGLATRRPFARQTAAALTVIGTPL